MNKNIIRTGTATAAVIGLFLILPFQNCAPQKFSVNEKALSGQLSLATSQFPTARTPANSGASTLGSAVAAGSQTQASAITARNPATTTAAASPAVIVAPAAASPAVIVAPAAASPAASVAPVAAAPAASPVMQLDFGGPVTSKNLQGGKYPFDVGFNESSSYISRYSASKIVTLSGLPAQGSLFQLRYRNSSTNNGLEGEVYGNINEEINAPTNPTPNLLNLSVNEHGRIVHNGDRIRMYGWPSAYFNTENSTTVELLDIASGALLASGSFSTSTTFNPYSGPLGGYFFNPNNVDSNAPGPIFSSTLTISGMGAGLHAPISFPAYCGSGMDVVMNDTVFANLAGLSNLSVKDGDTIKFRWNKPASFVGTASCYLVLELPGFRERVEKYVNVSFDAK